VQGRTIVIMLLLLLSLLQELYVLQGLLHGSFSC
jgi:hypothetical protein